MGRSGFSRASHDKELGRILSGEYNYLIALIPKNRNPNLNLLGEYEFFKEADEEEIRKYGKEFEELNKVELDRIEIWELGSSLLKKLKL